MNWAILALAAVTAIVAVALYEKVQRSIPRCPRCGARYVVWRGDGAWLCKACGWDGPEEDL